MIVWQSKKFQKQSKFRQYSMSKFLKKHNKSSDEFEIMLANLTFEEMISLRLELAAKTLGGKWYGPPLWQSLLDIVKDAVLRYAYSVGKTRQEAARFLGITNHKFHIMTWLYGTKNYFLEKHIDKKDEK